MKLYEYEGHLTDYYETGMEGSLGLMLQDNRGISPNPQYDPTKKGYPYDVPEWHSLNYSLWFQTGDEITVYNKDGSIDYQGKLTKDRKAMMDYYGDHGYYLSFIPKEVPLEKWISWFREQRKAKAISTVAPIAERD